MRMADKRKDILNEMILKTSSIYKTAEEIAKANPVYQFTQKRVNGAVVPVLSKTVPVIALIEGAIEFDPELDKIFTDFYNRCSGYVYIDDFVDYLNETFDMDCDDWCLFDTHEDSSIYFDKNAYIFRIFCEDDLAVVQFYDQRNLYNDTYGTPHLFRLSADFVVLPPDIGCMDCGWYVGIEAGEFVWSEHNPLWQDVIIESSCNFDPEKLKFEFTDLPPKEALQQAQEQASENNDIVLVDSLGQGYCPFCGKPLAVYFGSRGSEWRSDDGQEG
jgi:hypothetical protein